MKSKRVIPVLCVIMAAIGCFLATPASAAQKHQRDSWYIGFGIGGGLDARWKVDGETVTFNDWLRGLDKSPKLSMNFKVGGTLTPKTLLGFDGTLVSQTGSSGGLDATAQINNYFLMLTHFPWEEGLFLRLGGGLSNLYIDIDGFGDDRIHGYGMLGGIGYAFWLLTTFNLTVNLDYSRQWYSAGSDKPSSSQFTILYLGFDWY